MKRKKIFIGGLIGGIYGIVGIFLAHFGIISYPFLPSFWMFIFFAEVLKLDKINSFLPLIPNIIIWALIGIFIAKLIKRKKK